MFGRKIMQSKEEKAPYRRLWGLFSDLMFGACVAGALVSFWPASASSISWLNAFEWDAPARIFARNGSLDNSVRLKPSMAVVDPNGDIVILDDWNYTFVAGVGRADDKVDLDDCDYTDIAHRRRHPGEYR
jgi:hypothetical protein